MRTVAAPETFPSASSALAVAAVRDAASDALNSDALIARAADVAAPVSPDDAAAAASATNGEETAAAAAADGPAALYTSALIGTRVSTRSEIRPDRERKTATPSLLSAGDSSMKTVAPVAVSPDATHELGRAPGEREAVSATAPAASSAEDAHVRASARATAESAKTPPSNCVTFAVAAKNELTFWVTVTTADAAFAFAIGADDADADGCAVFVGSAAVAAGVALCSGAASVAAAVTDGDGDGEDAAIPEGGEIVVAPDNDGEPVCAGDGVVVGDAPRDNEDVGVLVPVCVGLRVTEPVGVPVAVSVAVPELEIGDVEVDAVTDADAPVESVGDGVALKVDDALSVVDALSLPEGVPLRVTVAVAESLPVGEAVGVRDVDCVVVVLAEPVSDPVELGLAPTVTLAVGVREMDRERLAVELVVSEDVGVGDAVREAVGVPLSDCVDVDDEVPLLLGVVDALAPKVTLVVAVWETEEESVAVELGV